MTPIIVSIITVATVTVLVTRPGVNLVITQLGGLVISAIRAMLGSYENGHPINPQG